MLRIRQTAQFYCEFTFESLNTFLPVSGTGIRRHQNQCVAMQCWDCEQFTNIWFDAICRIVEVSVSVVVDPLLTPDQPVLQFDPYEITVIQIIPTENKIRLSSPGTNQFFTFKTEALLDLALAFKEVKQFPFEPSFDLYPLSSETGKDFLADQERGLQLSHKIADSLFSNRNVGCTQAGFP